jgi:hypothetical protein
LKSNLFILAYNLFSALLTAVVGVPMLYNYMQFVQVRFLDQFFEENPYESILRLLFIVFAARRVELLSAPVTQTLARVQQGPAPRHHPRRTPNQAWWRRWWWRRRLSNRPSAVRPSTRSPSAVVQCQFRSWRQSMCMPIWPARTTRTLGHSRKPWTRRTTRWTRKSWTSERRTPVAASATLQPAV